MMHPLRAAVLCLVLIGTDAEAAMRSCSNGHALNANLFTRRYCVECDEARIFLLRESIPFLELNADDPIIQEHLNHGPGYNRLPALRICGRWIIGFGRQQQTQVFELLVHSVSYRP